MGRLRDKLTELKEKGERALVSYLMVGYPDLETSHRAFEAVLESGTDILEIGFPFSDPVADGTTIQVAHETALRNGITSREVFALSKDLRDKFPDIPFLLMTYYNPIFRMGHEKFCQLAVESGIDGFIVPDLPPEESGDLKDTMESFGLSLVMLASPTSTEERLRLICKASQDMVYFVSITGTTGARSELPFEELEENLKTYRKCCDKPVVVGFGISSKEQVERLSSHADGVVVGSLLVKLSSEGKLEDLKSKVRELKEGTIIEDR